MTQDTHGAKGEPWIGFDLDGTLAEYKDWEGIDHIGEPIKPMCDLIKKFNAENKKVKIVTARVAPLDGDNTREKARGYIKEWCKKNLGFVPKITHEKDALMVTLYDDRCQQVIPNKGVCIEEAAKSLIQGEENSLAKTLAAYLMDGGSGD